METAEAKMPSIGEGFEIELSHEIISLRKMLERIPEDKFEWSPSEKSMPLGDLASHCVNALGWTTAVIGADKLDFAETPADPPSFKTSADLIAGLEKNLFEAEKALKTVDDATMNQDWTLCDGDQIFFTERRDSVIRGFVMSHLIHHRGQLSVYLRLLDVPIPSIYGPSADEPM